MADTDSLQRVQLGLKTPIALPLGLLALALLLSAANLHGVLPIGQWFDNADRQAAESFAQLVFRYAALPRLAVAILAGAALGLAGQLFQIVLRNPIAEPTTLGASAGAHLALGIALLYAPWALDYGRELATLAGAGSVTAIVLALAARRGFSPLSVVLAGMIISLYASSVGAILVLFNHLHLTELFLWQSGSLVQNGWHDVLYLLPRLIVCCIITGLMVRPLTVLGLEDEGARSLGLGVMPARLIGLALATALSAFVVSAVGVIGFVGLAAPTLARLAGARRVPEKLAWSAALGAVLLWITDEIVKVGGRFAPEVPTGIVTALLGGLLLLWLLGRLRTRNQLITQKRPSPRLARPGLWLACAAAGLCLATWLSLSLGQDGSGWSWAAGDSLRELLPWRYPRMLVALGAGAGLAVAGLLLQRMTGNDLASPEVLGVSSGAALGVVLLIAAAPAFTVTAMTAAASAGALVTTGAIIWIARHNDYNRDSLLLTGIALGTALNALMALMLIGGDQRLGLLLRWLMGSTYRVTASQATTTVLAVFVLVMLALLTLRWLKILPLGDTVSTALGLNLAHCRIALIVLASLLTAVSTLAVGPVSFVGLLAPHMTRLMGFGSTKYEIPAVGLVGATTLVLADWAGRMIIFPWDIPAGLVATFIGGPYLLWLMRR